MKKSFEECIGTVLKHEGGYVDHPADPGGETNYGITKRSYPDLDIKGLTRDKAVAIYKRDYWERNGMEIFPAYIRLQMFDMAVNMGMKNAVKVLQSTLNRFGNNLTVDGAPGPKTFHALNKAVHLQCLPHFLAIDRLLYYVNLTIVNPKMDVFLKGWTRRANDVLMESLK